MAKIKVEQMKQEFQPVVLEKKGFFKKTKEYWSMVGPGITTGAADDDPSGIATYSQAGAKFGFSFLWLATFTFPVMVMIQEMCARIALVTGRGLAANIRLHFPRKLLFLCVGLLFVANTFNIGADIGAMAEAFQLLVPQVPTTILILGFGIICILFEVFVSYKKYSSYLKWMTLALLAYIVTGLFMNFDSSVLLYHAFVPHMEFSKEYFLILAAIVGTTISPYLFFWQTSQEVEEGILRGNSTVKERQKEGPKDIRPMRFDVFVGMLMSNLVMFFIISVCAGTLHKMGITNIETAADAANALRPIAGNFSYILFALGIIGTGLLAVPVLAASSAYALAEAFRHKEGLYLKLKEAKVFYYTIIASVLIGLLTNFTGLSAIKSLLYASIANAIIAPIIIVFIVILASNKRIMGTHVNSKVISFLGWGTVILMSLVGIFSIFSLV